MLMKSLWLYNIIIFIYFLIGIMTYYEKPFNKLLSFLDKWFYFLIVIKNLKTHHEHKELKMSQNISKTI